MNTPRRLQVGMLIVASLLGRPTCSIARDGKGDVDIDVQMGSINARANREFAANSDGMYRLSVENIYLIAPVPPVKARVSVEGLGDPFLEYELTFENIGVDDADVIFGATIDIDSTLAGQLATSTLQVEIIDPGGEGVDTTVGHRGFVQSEFQPSLLAGFADISEQLTSPGTFNFAVDAIVPESPHANDAFNRLRVGASFIIPPGDTYILRGNTTIVVPESADLNMDGFVDGLDLGILLANFEQDDIPGSGGELNGADPVDGLDLGILLGAWNPPLLSAVATVPEPSTIMLLAGLTAIRLVASSRRRVI